MIQNAKDLAFPKFNYYKKKEFHPDWHQLNSEALDLAVKIASKSPAVSKLVKALVNDGMQVDLRTALELERLAVIRHHSSEDMKEGISAFLQKRKPVFTGK